MATDRAAKRFERSDLRSDVRANPLPANPLRLSMGEIEAPRSRPIQTEFVLVAPGCDVRMAAGLHIGIHTDSHGRRRVALLNLPRGLADQHLEFRLRFDIK